MNLEVAITFVIMALKSSPFSNSLCKKPPTTLGKLRARVVEFIQMEEITRFKEKMCEETSRKLVDPEVKIESS